MSDSEQDDQPQLSVHALQALNEFLGEQVSKAAQDEVDEDWQLSQFWYNSATADALATEVHETLKRGTVSQSLEPGTVSHVAFLSSPTAFEAYVKLYGNSGNRNCFLLEFDRRFEKLHPEYFQFYDLYRPTDLDPVMHGLIDFFVIDPPFLSEECFEKVLQTVNLLKSSKTSKILFCTGAIMSETVLKLFGAKELEFKPQHARNLANEFRCFANYQTVHLK